MTGLLNSSNLINCLGGDEIVLFSKILNSAKNHDIWSRFAPPGLPDSRQGLLFINLFRVITANYGLWRWVTK